MTQQSFQMHLPRFIYLLLLVFLLFTNTISKKSKSKSKTKQDGGSNVNQAVKIKRDAKAKAKKKFLSKEGMIFDSYGRVLRWGKQPLKYECKENKKIGLYW